MAIEQTYTIKPKCDMLIDQNRYIDDDPIGHCCTNDADYQNGTHFLCKKCVEMIGTEPERITFGIGTVCQWNEIIKTKINTERSESR